MGRIIAGLASSHAYALIDPDDWDVRRKVTRANYGRRYGVEPPERPEVGTESPEDSRRRHARISGGLVHLRDRLQELRPDVLIMIGDDQDENFGEDNLPQFAIFTGESVVVENRSKREEEARGGPPAEIVATRYACDTSLSEAIHEGMVEEGFDLASSKRLQPGDKLRAHAHAQLLQFLDPEARIPLIPIFVNAIHVPAPTPARCYEFGAALRRVIEGVPDDKRVALYASGGLSHYTAGFPWPHYEGPATVGWINVDFDRAAVAHMAEGKGSELKKLSSKDLLDSGNIEMRQWVVLMGALGNVVPSELVYEPLFRGLMGMAVGCWDLEKEPVAAGATG